MLKKSLQEANPKLAKQWHPTKNNLLKPNEVTIYSHRKVWWVCMKGHEWDAIIGSRTRGQNCPYCSNKRTNIENCLQTTNPMLAKEWHPTKNELTPKEVTAHSGKKIWWVCKKGHIWKAIVADRSYGYGCPYCCNKYACKDNCLRTLDPKLSKEWHPSKNGLLTPDKITPNSGKKIWWLCNKGHEYEAVVSSRTRGTGCPYCWSQSSILELRVYSELMSLFSNVKLREKIIGLEIDVYIPEIHFGIEIDGHYWHKNAYSKDMLKQLNFQKYGISILRIREKGLKRISEDDIVFDKKDDHILIVNKIIKVMLRKYQFSTAFKNKLVKYSKSNKFINNSGFNKLLQILPSPLPGKSLADNNRILIQEWDYTKNEGFGPQDIAAHSTRKVWWKCKKRHSWLAIAGDRSRGVGCPYCSNRFVNIDNCLQTINPVLSKEWHPTKNELTPKDVTAHSGKKIWWICKKGHIWKATVADRSFGYGCPYCSGRYASLEKCLETVNPKLAAEWHATKNASLTPKDVTEFSHKNVWWKCNRGHEYRSRIADRSDGHGCPLCFNLIRYKNLVNRKNANKK